MKHVFLLFAVLLVTTSAFGAQGFVWANNPTSPSYAPDPNYAYNSAGGAITATRTSIGDYAVTFAGLGAAGAGKKSNVQVTAYNNRTTCTVVNWSGSPALTVRVRCFYIPDGSMKDSQYTLLVTFSP